MTLQEIKENLEYAATLPLTLEYETNSSSELLSVGVFYNDSKWENDFGLATSVYGRSETVEVLYNAAYPALYSFLYNCARGINLKSDLELMYYGKICHARGRQ